jgi:inorganic pyrophosphatase
VHDLVDFPSHFLREVEHFFKIYKDLEGKRVEIIGWFDAEEARRIIQESIDRYNAKYGAALAGA